MTVSSLLYEGYRLADKGWGGEWGGPWWVLIPLVWIALIALIVWLVTRARRPMRSSPTDPAVEILAARFARGEIDADEYQRRFDQLRDLS